MYATNYLEAAILNTMRGNAFTAPAKVYLALFLTSPTDAAAGTEVSYEGYQRLPVAFTPPAARAAAGGVSVENTEQITFATSPIDAGTVAFIGILDSPAAGNMLAWGELTDPLEVRAQVAPVFTPGTLVYTINGDLTEAYKIKYLDAAFRGRSVEGFTLHGALFNGDPEQGGAELSGENYSRVPLAMSAPKEAESGQMTIENSAAASFNRPTTNWGTWNYTALYDSASGGLPVWKQEKTPPWELKPGRMPLMEQGAVKISVN